MVGWGQRCPVRCFRSLSTLKLQSLDDAPPLHSILLIAEEGMAILLKFCWGDDVRRVRVEELAMDQVKAACLRIFAERLAPEDEDQIQLEFLWQGSSRLLTPTTFPELVVLYGQLTGAAEVPQPSLRLYVTEKEGAHLSHQPWVGLQPKLEQLEEFLPQHDAGLSDVVSTTDAPIPVKQEAVDEPSIGGFMEADERTVRRAARLMLKQVQRQREAARRDEKKAAAKWRKAKHKALRRMEKVARKLARKAAKSDERQRQCDKGKKSKRHKRKKERCVRSEPEDKELEADGCHCEDGCEERLYKKMRKERKKAARRLQRAARKAKKHRRHNLEGERTAGSDGEGTEGSLDPEKEVCHMVSVAFRGLLSTEEEVSRSWVRPVV
ncbi:hypothetical protein AK812_SmicGene25296 [Symbiodinium microadriaticum]|uniref:Uncharacterized protein n=1 Tax=Symbiodinium microadriaticum TaxID=2951 RepID=A0A1Q9DCN9_SYMMI|nr:hypothetical protein AK812_SmicGene25296 [Symbiodinium microadriaticum]CAE6958050.1 unnamed protein product [Symbiodinium sp. KB8]CAE7249673.1 unnamed protein product [Symbiodinium microadriaticum]